MISILCIILTAILSSIDCLCHLYCAAPHICVHQILASAKLVLATGITTPTCSVNGNTGLGSARNEDQEPGANGLPSALPSAISNLLFHQTRDCIRHNGWLSASRSLCLHLNIIKDGDSIWFLSKRII
ncbi:hypothetical protein DFS33DRAFT_842706 [Desarmillaria ectypa]|nr:hypothetical protein DFS33DRAFT_842706 [Desarmillaria ectypa]